MEVIASRLELELEQRFCAIGHVHLGCRRLVAFVKVADWWIGHHHDVLYGELSGDVYDSIS